MKNELDLFNGQNKPKFETTKELAEELGVTPMTILRTIKDLNIDVKVENGKPTKLNEAQATAIKIELQNHSKVAKNGYDTLTISNDLEMMLLQKKLDAYKDKRIAELEAENAEMKPKVEWYDNVADSTNLTEIGTVGKMTGIGEKKIFRTLAKDGVIREKCDSDGVKYYVPNFSYVKYFRTVPEPFLRGDKKLVRNKLLFTQDGVIWATKRYKRA